MSVTAAAVSGAGTRGVRRTSVALNTILASTAVLAALPAGAGDDVIALYGEIRPGGFFWVPESGMA